MTRADSRRVPGDKRAEVIKALYADAARVEWEFLPINQRTAQYDKWVVAPEIGGVLTDYMSAETARSWIKDGPMKEYSRAQQGVGRYSKFGSKAAVEPTQMVARALGPEATVVDGTFGVKPLHCVGISAERETYVTWGEAKNFRYLVWACLAYLASNPSAAAHVIVTETMADPTTASEKAQHAAVADRCGIGLSHYRIATAPAEAKVAE